MHLLVFYLNYKMHGATIKTTDAVGKAFFLGQRNIHYIINDWRVWCWQFFKRKMFDINLTKDQSLSCNLQVLQPIKKPIDSC